MRNRGDKSRSSASSLNYRRHQSRRSTKAARTAQRKQSKVNGRLGRQISESACNNNTGRHSNSGTVSTGRCFPKARPCCLRVRFQLSRGVRRECTRAGSKSGNFHLDNIEEGNVEHRSRCFRGEEIFCETLRYTSNHPQTNLIFLSLRESSFLEFFVGSGNPQIWNILFRAREEKVCTVFTVVDHRWNLRIFLFSKHGRHQRSLLSYHLLSRVGEILFGPISGEYR